MNDFKENTAIKWNGFFNWHVTNKAWRWWGIELCHAWPSAVE